MGAVAAGAAVAVMTAGCTAAGEVPTGLANTSVSRAPAVSGSSASSRAGVDDAFRARANAVCKPYSDFDLAHPFPFTTFDPEHPDTGLLPQVGDFFDQNPANHTLTQALASLGEPAAGGAEWHTALDASRRFDTLSREQITDARTGDAEAFVANVHTIRTERITLLQAFERAGFVQSVDFCAAIY